MTLKAPEVLRPDAVSTYTQEDMNKNQIDQIQTASMLLKYMRRCAYTQQVPSDSQELRNAIEGLDAILASPHKTMAVQLRDYLGELSASPVQPGA